MKKVVLLLSVCFLCHFSMFAQGIKFEKISLDQALERAKTEGKLVFIDFTASWCGPCQEMVRNVFSLNKVGDYFNRQFVSVQLDIDKEDKSVIEKYDVKSIPLFIILEPDGKVRHRILGAKAPEEFLEWAQRSVSGKNDLSLLKALLAKGQEMSQQEKIDCYNILKDAGEYRKADSIRNILFQELSPEKLCSEGFWSFFRNENYESKYFNYVVQHRDLFREKQGEGRINSYLAERYKQKMQNFIVFRNDLVWFDSFDNDSIHTYKAVDKVVQEVSGANDNAILGQKDLNIVLAWGKLAKAYFGDGIPEIAEGIKAVVKTRGWNQVSEWYECLWGPLAFVKKSGDEKDYQAFGGEYFIKLISSVKDLKEQWDFYQMFKQIGYPVSCNKFFLTEALQQAKEKKQPLLVECVRLKDRENSDWMWDTPEQTAYLIPLCMSVRIDMDDPEAVALQDKFKVKTYPAYFLLNEDGEIKCSWEGMIANDKLFRESIEEGLKKIK